MSVSAMRAGAHRLRGETGERPSGWRSRCATCSRARALAGELQRLKRRHEGTLTIADVITRSAAMQPVSQGRGKGGRLCHIGADSKARSGVGKELIARAIHGSGTRRAKPLRRGELRRHARNSGRSRSCSATRKAPSPVPPSAMLGNSSRPTAARCSSTKSGSCRHRRR